jgi:hypothetical protein
LKNLGVDGKKIKMDFQEGGWGINRIDLALERDRWKHL